MLRRECPEARPVIQVWFMRETSQVGLSVSIMVFAKSMVFFMGACGLRRTYQLKFSSNVQ